MLLDLAAGNSEVQEQLAAVIACSAAWLPGRERTKTNCIRLIHEMRMSMREIGRRMVERGAFDEIEDFGFVRAAEIDVLLDGDASTLLPLIRERRGEYRTLQTKVPPFAFVGSADGPDTWAVRGAAKVEHLAAGDELRGLPGCPGVAEGGRASSSTPTTPSRSVPAMCSSRRSPTRRGRRCSCRPPPSSSTSAPRSATPSSSAGARHPVRRVGDGRDEPHPHGSLVRVDGGAGVVTVVEV